MFVFNLNLYYQTGHILVEVVSREEALGFYLVTYSRRGSKCVGKCEMERFGETRTFKGPAESQLLNKVLLTFSGVQI